MAIPEQQTFRRGTSGGTHRKGCGMDETLTKGRQKVTVSMSVRLVLRDGIGVTDAAVGGCGIAFPIDISVRHLLRSGALRVILPEWSGGHYPVFAVMPPGRGNASAKVRVCLEFLKSVLSE